MTELIRRKPGNALAGKQDEVIKMWNSGAAQKDIAAHFGVTSAAISKLVKKVYAAQIKSGLITEL